MKMLKLIGIGLFCVSSIANACYYNLTPTIESCAVLGQETVILDCSNTVPVWDEPIVSCKHEGYDVAAHCSIFVNWGARLPNLVVCPEGQPPQAKTNITPDISCPIKGSVIHPDTLSYTEIIPLVGVPFNFVYSNDKVPGRRDLFQKNIFVQHPNLQGTNSKLLSISIAGQDHESIIFPPVKDSFFEWDGKDGQGNPVIGPRMANIKVTEQYSCTVPVPIPSPGGWVVISSAGSGCSFVAPTYSSVVLGSIYSPNSLIGGWNLDVRHHYDELRKVLHLGDGTSFNTTGQLKSNGDRWIVSSDRSEVYVFDANLRHIQTLDALTGIDILLFYYDSLGRLISVADKHGNQTTIQYSGSTPISITSPYGQVTVLTTNDNGYIDSVTSPASEAHHMTYTSTGLLLSFEKPSGVMSTLVYNANGSLRSDLSSAGNEVTLTQTPTLSGFRSTAVSALGRIRDSSVSIDATSYVRTDSFPDRSVQTLNSNRVTKDVSLSSSNNRIESIIKAVDTRFGGGATRPRSAMIGDLGIVMGLNFTEVFTLSNSSDPFSFTTLKKTQSLNQKEWSLLYTPENRTVIEKTPLGRSTTNILNPKGDVGSIQFSNLMPVTVDYDLKGRVSKISHGANRVTDLTYNASNGFIATIKNALNQITSLTYDLAGRINTQTLPDSRVINFSYDTQGNLTGVTPPGKPIHEMSYNGFDFLASYLSPANVSTTYVYNNDRELTEINRPDGSSVDLTYDLVEGNLNRIAMPNGNRNFSHNSGILTQASSEDFITRYFYYIGSGLESERTISGQFSNTVSYTYNSMGDIGQERLTILPFDVTTNFSFDDDRLLTQAGSQTLVRAPATGQLTQTDLGNLSQFFSYSPNFGELSEIEAVYSGSSIYLESMTRDNLGRISTRTEKYGTAASSTYAYSYDLSGRLTDVTLNGSPKSHYAYDSNSNRVGQTIDGVTLSGGTTTPVELSTFNGFNVGNAHTCAITSGGVKCWGKGNFGQLGHGNTENIGNNEAVSTIASVNINGNAKSLSLGNNFSCALLTNGNVRCWGLNDIGQLGLAHMNSLGDDEVPSTQPEINIGGEAKQIAVGGSHACALKVGNLVTCWGNGANGRLGYGNINNVGDDESPASAGDVATGATEEIIQIVAGAAHTCILTSTGKVKCWGGNGARQLGQGNRVIGDNETPATIPFLALSEPVKQLAAGGHHTCAITQSNKLKCWGQNDFGQLGLATTTTPIAYSSALANVDVGDDVKSVQAGTDTTCVITVNDQSKCWGKNDHGQLGQGNIVTIGDDEHPSTIPVLSLGGPVTSIKSANQHTCATIDSGDMLCWGLGTAGRLGYGNRTTVGDDEAPVLVGNIPGINLGVAPPAVGAITYDDEDRLTKFGTKTFTYNANGELTSETNSATSITKNFVYDVFGNLKQVTLPTKTVNYAVDAQNRRIIKKDGTTIENYFIWNANNQLIGITDGAGILISRFVYGSKSHVPDYMMRSGVNYQIVSNHLGSPVAVVNSATGEIVQEITYDEFGNKTSDTAPGFIPFGFAGCLYDEDTGLCRFGARDYDPSVGRWLSKDPILFNGGDMNLYGYVMQDPINLIDPSGNVPIIPGLTNPGGNGGAIGAIGGAAIGGSLGSTLGPAGTYGGAFLGSKIGGALGGWLGGGNGLDPNAAYNPRPQIPMLPPTGPMNPTPPSGGYSFPNGSPSSGNSCTPSYTGPTIGSGR